MKTELTLITCIIALFVTGANAQKPDTAKPVAWHRYTVDGAGFSVALPLLPAMNLNTRYREEWDKERKTLQLGAYADGVVYTVFVLENPSPKVSLQEFIGEFTSASANSERNIDRFIGKVFVSADRDGMAQYFATEDNLYAFRAFGAPVEDARLTRFFSSLSFSNTKGAIAVHDGPGDSFVPVVQPGLAEVKTPDKIFSGKEVTRKVRLGMKPDPRYTEEARQNGISGTVILKCAFASDGSVRDITITAGLPYGLTERAVAAAKKIKFIPAMKDGKYVSMWIQLEYNFNLY
jgi:TonB family protein